MDETGVENLGQVSPARDHVTRCRGAKALDCSCVDSTVGSLLARHKAVLKDSHKRPLRRPDLYGTDYEGDVRLWGGRRKAGTFRQHMNVGSDALGMTIEYGRAAVYHTTKAHHAA
jgi:hypothetical protein